jgi:hypothetical protein
MPLVKFGFIRMDTGYGSTISYSDANFTLIAAQKVYAEFGPNVVDFEITSLLPGLPFFFTGKGSHPGPSASCEINLPAGTFRAGLSRFQDFEAKGSIRYV